MSGLRDVVSGEGHQVTGWLLLFFNVFIPFTVIWFAKRPDDWPPPTLALNRELARLVA